MSGHASWVLGVTFAPDGLQFASSSSDHTVKVWDLAQRQCLHTFRDHTDQVTITNSIIDKIILIYNIHQNTMLSMCRFGESNIILQEIICLCQLLKIRLLIYMNIGNK